jgi:hypothetical protein
MDQLRELQSLDPANPPYRAYLDIPGCGMAMQPASCTLATFTSLVRSKLQ